MMSGTLFERILCANEIVGAIDQRDVGESLGKVAH